MTARTPREFWICVSRNGKPIAVEKGDFRPTVSPIIKCEWENFREVMPDEPDWKGLASELAKALLNEMENYWSWEERFPETVAVLAKYEAAIGDKK